MHIRRSTIDLVILFDCACVDECCFLDPTKVFTEQGRYLRKQAGNRAPLQYLQSYTDQLVLPELVEPEFTKLDIQFEHI